MMVQQEWGTVKRAPRGSTVASSLSHGHRDGMRPSRKERDQRAAEIGARITEARESAGWTNKTTFAAKVGTDRNTVGRWEKGESVPDALLLDAVSRITLRSADWILRGEAAPEWSETIEKWRKTPTGSRAPDAALGFIKSLPLGGYTPSMRFLDLVFTAWEHDLKPDEAVQMAAENITAESIR